MSELVLIAVQLWSLTYEMLFINCQKKAIHAKHCPCNNHVLNNTFAKSSKVFSCWNTSATMKKSLRLQMLLGNAIKYLKTNLLVQFKRCVKFVGLKNMIVICNFKVITWLKFAMHSKEFQLRMTAQHQAALIVFYSLYTAKVL